MGVGMVLVTQPSSWPESDPDRSRPLHSNDSPDIRVKAFDEHEESVYALAWSAADPFLFASASYDGRIVVNAVPPSEKYKILL